MQHINHLSPESLQPLINGPDETGVATHTQGPGPSAGFLRGFGLNAKS